MRLQIMSRAKIEKHEFDDSTVAISIRSPEGSLIESEPAKIDENVDVLRLIFDDVDQSIFHGYKLFQPEQALEILEFARINKNKLIICQCAAGISRSSGTAAALSHIHNGNDKWVFDSPEYLPNMRVYRIILECHYYGGCYYYGK